MMPNSETYEFLRDKVGYAQRSFNLELIHEVHGMVKMAKRLNAITTAQSLELSHIVCRECINNPEWRRRADNE